MTEEERRDVLVAYLMEQRADRGAVRRKLRWLLRPLRSRGAK